MSNAERVRVKGISIHRAIVIGNTAILLTPEERQALQGTEAALHTHRWTLAVRSAASKPDSDIVGGADDLGYFIKRVSFKLHESFANATRNFDKEPFEVTETGWGEFEVTIRINFVPEAAERQITTYHHLKLHPWPVTGIENPEAPPYEDAVKFGPVHSWQYEEIVFNDPFQNFLNILTVHPPTPLPKTKRRPTPFNGAHNASLEPGSAGVPEFTAAMEQDELDRIEAAKKSVIAENENYHALLIEKEREVERLRKELGE